MELQEVADNDETVGFSKRRISSILKVPRKSARFTDQEQQENVVQCAKPFEKRSSKRVSFAPGDNVLVFSKDVKSTTSSQRIPQELKTASGETTQNRVTGAGDGTQNMMGKQSVLNDPLRASQDQIRCDRDEGIGEKTVVFSSDDAYMDMTQSHSVNVAHYTELLEEGFPNFGEKTVMFTANDASMDLTLNHTMKITEGNASRRDGRHLDLNVDKRSLPSTIPILDLGFEGLLASLSKPSLPASNNSFPHMGSETRDVDKENWLPASRPAGMEKSINTFRNHAEASQRSVLFPDNDVSMNLTEVQTSSILGITDANDQFKFIFPTQDTCVSTDKSVPQKNETNRTSSVSKDMTFSKNTHRASTQKHKVNFDAGYEKTIIFNTDNDFMDPTQSCTVNIARAVAAPQKASGDGLDLGFNNFLSGLFKTPSHSGNNLPSAPGSTKGNSDTDSNSTRKSAVRKAVCSLNTRRSCRKSSAGSKEDPGADVDMDLTEARTTHLANSVDPLHLLFPTQEPHPQSDNLRECVMKNTGTQDDSGLRTSLKSSVKTSLQKHQFGEDHQEQPAPSSSHCGESYTFCMEGDISMDMTEAQTGRIVGITHPDDPPQRLHPAGADLKTNQGYGMCSTNESSTVCPEADVSMDMTETQTGRIHTGKQQAGPTRGRASLAANGRRPSTAAPTSNSEDFTICLDGDISMDMTEAQTGRIFGVTPSDAAPLSVLSTTQPFSPEDGNSKSKQRYESHGAPRVRASLAFNARRPSTAAPPSNDLSTLTCPDGDISMDLTRAQTGRIVEIALAHDDPHLSSQGAYPQGSDLKIQTAQMTSKQMEHFATDSVLPQTNKQQFGATWGRPSLAPHAKMPSTVAPPSNARRSTVVCPDGDVSMDMTETQTGRIVGLTPADDPQLFVASPDVYPETRDLKRQTESVLYTRKQQAGPTRGRASLAFNARRPSTAAPPLNDDPSTVTCPDGDISMDLTRAQTGRIVEIALSHDDPHLSSQGAYPQGSDLKIQTAQMTSKQTGHFATDSVLPQTNKQQFGSTWGRQSLAPHAEMPSTVAPPSNARRSTVVCPEVDVSMDMTEVQTGRISGIMPIDDPPQPPSAALKYDKRGPNGHQTPSALIAKTPSTAAPFTNYQESDTVDDGCDVSMDMTEAQTGGILGVSGADDPTQCLSTSQGAFQQNDDAAKSNLQSADPPGASVFTGAKKSLVERRQMTDSKVEEEQLRTDQAVPNVMSCLGRKSEVILPRQDPLLKFTHRNTDLPSTVKTTQRNRSLSARGRSLGFKSSFPLTGLPWANAAITKTVTTADQQPLPGGMEQPEENAAHVTVDMAPGRDDHSQNETTRDFPSGNMSMDMTEVQTGHIPGPTSDVSPTVEPGSDLTKATLLQGNTQMDTHPHEAVNREMPEDKSEPKKTESLSGAAVEQNTEEPCSRKSRRISLANLQSKARRLSQMINAAPEAFALEGATATLPQTDRDSDLKTLKDKTLPLPSAVPGPVRDVTWSKPQDSSKDECPTPEEVFPTTPHHLKTKLMSRLSVGAFKPKLPQRNTSSDTKKKNSDDDVTKAMTVNLTAHLDNGDNDVSDIYEEELGSYEDVSETLDNSSPPKLDSKEPEEDDVPEEEAVAGKKRPLPKDENRGDENMKRRRSSTESSADVVGMHHQSLQEFDGNSAPNTTTHTTDYSSSSHASSMRCEGTFESTFKQSMFESQLEDYTSETQRKLDDGSMTVLEFLKLFNIDFVIHNPRQSVLPGKIPSETQRTQMDVLKDRHISLPRQLVYEEDVQELKEKVEGLKMRMQDLEKPLRMVNKDLWEELRDSSEKELKSFGSSLKERNNFYKKMGKARSHEMKEVLYRNLVQTNQEEQQKLRGTIDRADEMIRSLDECIGQLESELAEIEEKGSEEKPSLKTLQQELETVTKAVAENERQQSELELQNKQNSSKTERLKVETKNLRKHVDTLHRITEWTFGDRTDDSTVYSFLYDSVHLQVDYGKSQETADGHSEREIKDIAFKLRLNDETSECHARLVHKLVSQFVRGQRSLVEKYPTSGHVPKLLHDVSLVVSRCRLLGEELRLLKMWGATKLDILDLTCLDTQVHVVFSSLKKLSKFQVVFSITLKQRLCVVKLERCSNIYGQAEIQKIDDIVASFTPGRNVFTKIIKRIHADLLR